MQQKLIFDCVGGLVGKWALLHSFKSELYRAIVTDVEKYSVCDGEVLQLLRNMLLWGENNIE